MNQSGRGDRPSSPRQAAEKRTADEQTEEPPSRAHRQGRTPQVAGSDEQQPEIAEGPVPGVQPGEEAGNPDRWTPPLEVDPPTGPDIPQDAAGDTEAVRRQKERGGP